MGHVILLLEYLLKEIEKTPVSILINLYFPMYLSQKLQHKELSGVIPNYRQAP